MYFGSRRKTGDINVTAIWSERTGNEARFTGYRSSIRQLSFLLARDRGCLREAHITPVQWRRDWATRSLIIQSIARRGLVVLTIRSIARRSFVMLMSAPVCSWLFLLGSDRAAYRVKEISEGPGFRDGDRANHSKDRQPKDNCAQRSLHQDTIVSAAWFAWLSSVYAFLIRS